MKTNKIALLLICILFSALLAEKVGSIRYTGYPEYLNGRTIKRDADIVALAEKLTAFDSTSSFTSGGGATSIMLVIDHSTSMLLNLVGNSNPLPKDPDGVRFSVASKLIDEIQKKSPETEIGLSVFSTYLYLDPNDDPLIEELNTYKKYSKIQGGFLPLMKLNKEVTKGNFAGMTGAEVLKKYLETKDTTVNYKGNDNLYKKLAYEPTNGLLDPLRVKEEFNQTSGTNIWAGFAAAKEAMLKSSVTPKNQFIIFFSDGDHSHIPTGVGPTGFGWEDEVAETCPTSFCVYFDTKGVDWPMEKLLDKIKNNTYSSSNPLSSFKKMSAGEDEVMKYMKESVISKIVTNTTYVTPEEVTLNGTTTSNWIKAKDWFEFNDLFALKKGDANYDMSLRYSRKVVDANSGEETPLADTTVNVRFTVSGTSGETMGDSLATQYWGRELKLFNGSTEIVASDVIDETIADLTLQFSSYEVDTTYDYDKIPIIVTTVNGSDREEIMLQKSGSLWRFNITREEGSNNSGDGTLQHQNPDTLVFTFQNPDLPLDTLQIKRYYYQESSAITLQDASLFDTDADGLSDSIAITFVGKDAETVKDKIVDALILAKDRNYTINKSVINGSTLSLNVKQGNGTIVTTTDNSDTIVVENEVTLNDKLFLNPCRLTLTDKMAPVVLSASVIDSADENGRDEMTVTFSEDIKESSIGDAPFELYSLNEAKIYTAKLKALTFNSDRVIFEITSVNGRDRIENGDSIRIDAGISTVICDKESNAQKNNNNLRQEITVEIIDKAMSLGDAALFDSDANGSADRLELQIRGGELSDDDAKKLASKLNLPTDRKFDLVESEFTSGSLILSIKEQSGKIKTYTDKADTVSLLDTFFLSGSDAFIIPSRVSLDDKMAPVVISASLVDSAKAGSRDELTVRVSEKLESFTTDKPFAFYAGTSKYVVTLSLLEKSGTELLFEVKEIAGKERVEDGDSLHFNTMESLSDDKGNGQENEDNIKHEIAVTVIEEGIKITDAIYYDTNANGTIDLIRCPMYGKKTLIEKHLDTIVTSLELNKDRKFEIRTYDYVDGELRLEVKEQSGNVNTSVTSKDKVALKNKIIITDDSTQILTCEVPCVDSVAPIIIEASVVDSMIVVLIGEKDSLYTNANGELRVTFSEEVDDHSVQEPFLFFHGKDQYEATVEALEFNGNKVLYQLLNIELVDKVEDGDSICIATDIASDLVDLGGVAQENEHNIKCQISVETLYDTIRVPAPYDLLFTSTILQRGYEEDASRGDDSIPRMVIIIEPDKKENFSEVDSLSGSLVLFDPVGNVVTSEMKLEFEADEKRLILFWDGKNTQKRNVGRGSCVVVAELQMFFEGEIKGSKVINTRVGIQEKK